MGREGRSEKKRSENANNPDLALRVSRQSARIKVDCPAILALPSRNAHPRIKGHLIQIGQGGCSLTTQEHLFIGEDCLVWAVGGGHKYLGVPGKIVWMKSIYKEHEMRVVGIEFMKPCELTLELLAHLGAKAIP